MRALLSVRARDNPTVQNFAAAIGKPSACRVGTVDPVGMACPPSEPDVHFSLNPAYVHLASNLLLIVAESISTSSLSEVVKP